MRAALAIAMLGIVAASGCGGSETTAGGPAAATGTAPGVPSVPDPRDEVRVLASGELDGVTWRAFGRWMGDTALSERLCLESDSERFPPAPVCPAGLPPLSSYGSMDRILDVPQTVFTGDLQFVVGVAEKGIVRVTVEAGSGAPVEATVIPEHSTYYVAALPRTASPVEVVAYALSGAELDRRAPAAPADGAD
jgi:hypothetical protein